MCRPLEKATASHSSVLAWRIPGTGEPGGLPSMGSHRVGHDWRDLASAAAAEQAMGLWQSLISWFSHPWPMWSICLSLLMSGNWPLQPFAPCWFQKDDWETFTPPRDQERRQRCALQSEAYGASEVVVMSLKVLLRGSNLTTSHLCRRQSWKEQV